MKCISSLTALLSIQEEADSMTENIPLPLSVVPNHFNTEI